jgi:hypothetical protein
MEFEMQPYIVYVKVDDKKRITAVHSSAFIPDPSGWIDIDSGFETKHHHAQGNYFSQPIMDERGICRYKLEDGKPVERTQDEMDADYTPPVPKPSDAERIAALEEELAAAKILLGVE